MNDKLTDEAYARAALTYLAEPTDRWLGQLLRVHGAAATLDAIKSGQPLGTAGPAGNSPGPETALGLPRGKGREAVKAAMERWRTRLPELPAPEEIARLRRVGDQAGLPGRPGMAGAASGPRG